jgi:hypothetical protein
MNTQTNRSRKVCPPGMILRSAYKRKFTKTIKKQGYVAKRGSKLVRIYPSSHTSTVKATCVKDKGLKGKSAPGIGPLKKGELSKHGYHSKRPEAERHAALKRAVADYGGLATYRKLDAVTKLSLRSAPEAHKVFQADRNWVYNHYVKQ